MHIFRVNTCVCAALEELKILVSWQADLTAADFTGATALTLAAYNVRSFLHTPGKRKYLTWLCTHMYLYGCMHVRTSNLSSRFVCIKSDYDEITDEMASRGDKYSNQ